MVLYTSLCDNIYLSIYGEIWDGLWYWFAANMIELIGSNQAMPEGEKNMLSFSLLLMSQTASGSGKKSAKSAAHENVREFCKCFIPCIIQIHVDFINSILDVCIYIYIYTCICMYVCVCV